MAGFWLAGAGVAAYEDGFTMLALTRKYYREVGLDVRQLESNIHDIWNTDTK